MEINKKCIQCGATDKLLELELKTRDNPIINGFLNTRIEQNLNSFQKRKIRR